MYCQSSPTPSLHLGRKVDVTGGVDEVDEEGAFVDLHVVSLGALGLRGRGRSVCRHLRLFCGLASRLRGLGLQLGPGYLFMVHQSITECQFSVHKFHESK